MTSDQFLAEATEVYQLGKFDVNSVLYGPDANKSTADFWNDGSGTVFLSLPTSCANPARVYDADELSGTLHPGGGAEMGLL